MMMLADFLVGKVERLVVNVYVYTVSLSSVFAWSIKRRFFGHYFNPIGEETRKLETYINLFVIKIDYIYLGFQEKIIFLSSISLRVSCFKVNYG